KERASDFGLFVEQLEQMAQHIVRSPVHIEGDVEALEAAPVGPFVEERLPEIHTRLALSGRHVGLARQDLRPIARCVNVSPTPWALNQAIWRLRPSGNPTCALQPNAFSVSEGSSSRLATSSPSGGITFAGSSSLMPSATTIWSKISLIDTSLPEETLNGPTSADLLRTMSIRRRKSSISTKSRRVSTTVHFSPALSRL